MFFVGLGFVGVFVPGIPTTPSILAAAWFFARSSKRFEQWLLNHKIFGQIIRDWQQHGGIARKSKNKCSDFNYSNICTNNISQFL